MCLKESNDQWDVESETENVPTEDILEADSVCEWFYHDHKNMCAQTDILNIIKICMKEVKKFHTPHAFESFSDLAAIMQYHKLLRMVQKQSQVYTALLVGKSYHCHMFWKGVTNGAYFVWRIQKN